MKLLVIATVLFLAGSPQPFAQDKSVESQKFVFLNNGATIGMIVKSVLKADKQRLTLTDTQLPKARQIITDATVQFNEGVKKLKASGLTSTKLRALAIVVETKKAHDYQTILSPEQYRRLVANHNKLYPEGRL